MQTRQFQTPVPILPPFRINTERSVYSPRSECGPNGVIVDGFCKCNEGWETPPPPAGPCSAPAGSIKPDTDGGGSGGGSSGFNPAFILEHIPLIGGITALLLCLAIILFCTIKCCCKGKCGRRGRRSSVDSYRDNRSLRRTRHSSDASYESHEGHEGNMRMSTTVSDPPACKSGSPGMTGTDSLQALIEQQFSEVDPNYNDGNCPDYSTIQRSDSPAFNYLPTYHEHEDALNEMSPMTMMAADDCATILFPPVAVASTVVEMEDLYAAPRKAVNHVSRTEENLTASTPVVEDPKPTLPPFSLTEHSSPPKCGQPSRRFSVPVSGDLSPSKKNFTAPDFFVKMPTQRPASTTLPRAASPLSSSLKKRDSGPVPPNFRKTISIKPEPLARATYSYEANRPDEMQLYVGDIIKDLKEEKDGWWTGTNERTGLRAMFPFNYVKFIHMG